jgi:hypothetical protein
VAHWKYREELSHVEKLRRSYYELLRDELDQFLLQHALIDSYENFSAHHISFPFVEKREMKPRGRIPDREYETQNAFLVIFVEDAVLPEHKKYIRYFDVNKTTKQNLLRFKTISLSEKFDRNWKYLESIYFRSFLKIMLPVDYALLIQGDSSSRTKNRYGLTHFHVRIDWPITEAAEDMARSLRYISKDIFEKGDKYAEDIQKKFFEYYGLPVMVGGRRTAAIVAAQYLKRIPGISTIYVGSSESRALIRISERGISKSVLIKRSIKELNEIADENKLTPQTFRKNYIVAREKRCGICIFQASYTNTYHAREPEDGKLRELKSDLHWLTVGEQHILPKPGIGKYPPIPLNLIYT